MLQTLRYALFDDMQNDMQHGRAFVDTVVSAMQFDKLLTSKRKISSSRDDLVKVAIAVMMTIPRLLSKAHWLDTPISNCHVLTGVVAPVI
jgi:hypothetical protein